MLHNSRISLMLRCYFWPGVPNSCNSRVCFVSWDIPGTKPTDIENNGSGTDHSTGAFHYLGCFMTQNKPWNYKNLGRQTSNSTVASH
jgi:hypothetical protein